MPQITITITTAQMAAIELERLRVPSVRDDGGVEPSSVQSVVRAALNATVVARKAKPVDADVYGVRYTDVHDARGEKAGVLCWYSADEVEAFDASDHSRGIFENGWDARAALGM